MWEGEIGMTDREQNLVDALRDVVLKYAELVGRVNKEREEQTAIMKDASAKIAEARETIRRQAELIRKLEEGF